MDKSDIKQRFLKLETREDVATLLGISERSLRYYLYKRRPENMYFTFEIPKKDGSKREISAPSKELKNIQRKLADVLSAVYDPKVCAYLVRRFRIVWRAKIVRVKSIRSGITTLLLSAQ